MSDTANVKKGGPGTASSSVRTGSTNVHSPRNKLGTTRTVETGQTWTRKTKTESGDWIDSEGDVRVGTPSTTTSEDDESTTDRSDGSTSSTLSSSATDSEEKTSKTLPPSARSNSSSTSVTSPRPSTQTIKKTPLQGLQNLLGLASKTEKRAQELGKLVHQFGFQKTSEFEELKESFNGWPRVKANPEGRSESVPFDQLPEPSQKLVQYRNQLVETLKVQPGKPFVDKEQAYLENLLPGITHELDANPPQAGTGLFRGDSLVSTTWLVSIREKHIQTYVENQVVALLTALEATNLNTQRLSLDTNLALSEQIIKNRLTILIAVVSEFIENITENAANIPSNLGALLTGIHDHLQAKQGAIGCDAVVPALLFLRTLCPPMLLTANALKNTTEDILKPTKKSAQPNVYQSDTYQTDLGNALYEAVVLLQCAANNSPDDKLSRYKPCVAQVRTFINGMQDHFRTLRGAIVTPRGSTVTTTTTSTITATTTSTTRDTPRAARANTTTPASPRQTPTSPRPSEKTKEKQRKHDE